MKSKRSRQKLKLLSGGKQLSFIKQTEEVLDFVSHQQFTEMVAPCNWFFSLLLEDEDNLQWILDNLDGLGSREKLISQDEIIQRLEVVSKAIRCFLSWSADPIGWEQEKPRISSDGFLKSQKRTLTFPLSGQKVIEITLPKEGISFEDLKGLGAFLKSYCLDADSAKTRSWVADYPEPQLPRTCT